MMATGTLTNHASRIVRWFVRVKKKKIHGTTNLVFSSHLQAAQKPTFQVNNVSDLFLL